MKKHKACTPESFCAVCDIAVALLAAKLAYAISSKCTLGVVHIVTVRAAALRDNRGWTGDWNLANANKQARIESVTVRHVQRAQ